MVLEIQLTTGRRIWTDSLESHICRENICIKRCLLFVHPWRCIKAKSSGFTLMRPTATVEAVWPCWGASPQKPGKNWRQEPGREMVEEDGLLAHSCLLLVSVYLALFHSPGNLLMDDSSHSGLASAASTVSQDNVPHTYAQSNCDLGNPPNSDSLRFLSSLTLINTLSKSTFGGKPYIILQVTGHHLRKLR